MDLIANLFPLVLMFGVFIFNQSKKKEANKEANHMVKAAQPTEARRLPSNPMASQSSTAQQQDKNHRRLLKSSRFEDTVNEVLDQLPKNLRRKTEAALNEERPQALKQLAIRLSAYHPQRKTLLEFAKYYEDYLSSKQESMETISEMDLEESSEQLADLSSWLGSEDDLSDWENFQEETSIEEVARTIIQGEGASPNPDLTSANPPLRTERLTQPPHAKPLMRAHQIRQAMIWSEIVGPPKSKK